MNRIFTVGTVLLLILGIYFGVTSTVRAQETADQQPIESIETNNQDRPQIQFHSDSQLVLDQAYSGTVVAVGGEVTMSGLVTGNLVVAGGSVLIPGTVYQDIFVAGGTVIISGDVSGNIFVAGGEVQLLPEAVVGGSVMAAGEYITHQGTIDAASWLVANTVAVHGVVNNDLWVGAEEVTVESEAVVQGTLRGKYQERMVNDAAQVGSVELEQSQSSARYVANPLLAWLFAVAWYWAVGGVLLIAWKWFAPQILERGVKLWEKQPSRTLLSGVVFTVTVPVFALFVTATLIGVPIAIVFMALWCVALWTGWLFVVIGFGRRFFKKYQLGWSEWAEYAVMLGVMAVTSALPSVGWVFQFVFAAWGAGVWWVLGRKAQKT